MEFTLRLLLLRLPRLGVRVHDAPYLAQGLTAGACFARATSVTLPIDVAVIAMLAILWLVAARIALYYILGGHDLFRGDHFREAIEAGRKVRLRAACAFVLVTGVGGCVVAWLVQG